VFHITKIITRQLKNLAPTSCHHQQVQFGTGVSCPEVGISGFKYTDHMLDCKTLPGCTDLRVSLQISYRIQLEQAVEFFAVTL
jgi:hypothetical protein